MSQRDSGYARRPNDSYSTPDWVTEAIVPFIGHWRHVWEPACGKGAMVRVLSKTNKVLGTDAFEGVDLKVNFLRVHTAPDEINAIVTNPPFGQAQRFIEHALRLMEDRIGTVAMLLRTDYDHAKTRAHLFKDCMPFWGKLVLTRRIVWFKRKKAAPSYNHAWFIWDWANQSTPGLYYYVEDECPPTTNAN